MNATKTRDCKRRITQWLPYVMVAMCVAVCAAALILRGPLIGRYHAYQLSQSNDIMTRIAHVGAIVQLGDDARWGVSALLSDDDPSVRQCGVLVIRQLKTTWRDALLKPLLFDKDFLVREVAASEYVQRRDETVIPALVQIFREGDDRSAQFVANGLAEIGTSQSEKSWLDLMAERERMSVQQLAAMLRVAVEFPSAECVAILESLLGDGRTISNEQMGIDIDQVLARAALQQEGVTDVSQGDAGLFEEKAEVTIGELAKKALAEMEGVLSQ